MVMTCYPIRTERRADLAALLLEYARQIDMLAPSSRDPERFHVNKSEIAGGLRELAREVSNA